MANDRIAANVLLRARATGQLLFRATKDSRQLRQTAAAAATTAAASAAAAAAVVATAPAASAKATVLHRFSSQQREPHNVSSRLAHVDRRSALRWPPAATVSTVKMTTTTSMTLTSTRALHVTAALRDMTLMDYEKQSKLILEMLSDYFEELLEESADTDVNLSDGVLTVKLGQGRGTYVINKQTPNRQIWLSSPVSGPKRYDYVDSEWIYKHDNRSMLSLLTEELRELLKDDTIDFTSLR